MVVAKNSQVLEEIQVSCNRREVDVMIVGAGISGMMAAYTLQQHGVQSIQLIDKGRSPGGRLATRRVGTGRFDHGAQFLTAHSSSFQKIVDQWLNHGWVSRWFTHTHTRYAAVGGMNTLAKHVSHPLPVLCSHLVEKISSAAQGYEIVVKDTSTGEFIIWLSRSVILTAPIPQSLTLIDAGLIEIDQESREKLLQVTYTPCIGALLLFDSSLQKLGDFWEKGHLREPQQSDIAWIADNHHKGISSVPALTVHMQPTWSKIHYSDVDEDVFCIIDVQLKPILGESYREHLSEYQIKRWRYAQAHQMITEPYLELSNGNEGTLMITGDAFGGNYNETSSRVEHAVLSGLEAGKFLARKAGSIDS
jgi:renalase